MGMGVNCPDYCAFIVETSMLKERLIDVVISARYVI
jgi:hypothetical protein